MVTLTPKNAASIVAATGSGVEKVSGTIVRTNPRKYGDLEPVPVSAPDRGLAVGLYGPGGVGKTTLAASITDSELGSPALLLNARGNPYVISSYGDRIDVITVSAFKQLEPIRRDLMKDPNLPYKSVILDNVTEMFYMDLRDLYGPAGDVDWTKHSATTADVLQLVRNWMDLVETGPLLNVVFVFQETPESRVIRGEKIDSRSEIAFNKALQSQIPTIINFMGRLYIYQDTPPYGRMLDFTPNEKIHQAKFQIDPKHPEAGTMPMLQYNPSLASILDSVRGNKPWPTEKHSKPGVQGGRAT